MNDNELIYVDVIGAIIFENDDHELLNGLAALWILHTLHEISIKNENVLSTRIHTCIFIVERFKYINSMCEAIS